MDKNVHTASNGVNKRVKLRTESKTFPNNLADSTYNKYDELWILKSIDKNSFFIFHSLQFCAKNIDWIGGGGGVKKKQIWKV